MLVLHLNRRQGIGGALGILAVAAAILLAGCFGGESEPLTLDDNDARVAYLTSLGWEVGAQPLETLDLQLPETWGDTWQSYAALQTQQGFPFAEYAGRDVRRYTYAVSNYPATPEGVQANLYLCDGVLIGGDIIVTGKGGFQTVLAFPD